MSKFKLLALDRNSSKGITDKVCIEHPDNLTVIRVFDSMKTKWTSIKQVFAEIFLPRGYPESVCPDYLEYQIWDSLQAFGSSITGTLATHNVLKGLGVGNESASVMSATITWLLKDGTGMIGRIVFTYYKGSNLDVDCKKWRLFADILNDFAIGLDMICPMFPDYILWVQCSSGFMKSLVGTIGSATRASLTQHQARDNNLADVSAKDASQETLVNLSALLTSLVMVPLIAGSNFIIWSLFVIMTMAHIYCNYRAVKSVNMEFFNPSRLASFVQEYIATEKAGSIEEINRKENVWFFFNHPFQYKIESGVYLVDHFVENEKFSDFIKYSESHDYILSYDYKNSKKIFISFILGRDSARIKLKAYFHAILILLYVEDEVSAEHIVIKSSITNVRSDECENSDLDCHPISRKRNLEEILPDELIPFLYDEYIKVQGKNSSNPRNVRVLNVFKFVKRYTELTFDTMLINAANQGWKLDNFICLDKGWRYKLYDKED